MIADEIEKLKKLHDSGALTQEEFERAKQRVLSGETSADPGKQATAAINAFRLSNTDRWLGGVCGGLAQVTGVESWVWRLIWVALLFAGGVGFFAYILLWIFVPRAD
jgi:phage shock protein C